MTIIDGGTPSSTFDDVLSGGAPVLVFPETITWVPPVGDSLVLTDLRGITGRGHPPVELNSLTVPLQPGSVFRSVRDAARQVVIPVLCDGDTMVDYRAYLRALTLKLHPTEQPGVLQVATIDGQTRELTCWYTDGFGWLEEYPDWGIASLLFQALDPYWYDGADTQADFAAGEAATFFPFFPLRLSSSEVFADSTVDNTGDVDAWPIWAITGPGSGLMLRNLTTGKSLELDRAISAGESVTIDTRPGVKSVTLQDGTNLFDLISGSLWPLAAGSNSVRLELSGASDATVITLRYRRRFLSA